MFQLIHQTLSVIGVKLNHYLHYNQQSLSWLPVFRAPLSIPALREHSLLHTPVCALSWRCSSFKRLCQLFGVWLFLLFYTSVTIKGKRLPNIYLAAMLSCAVFLKQCFINVSHSKGAFYPLSIILKSFFIPVFDISKGVISSKCQMIDECGVSSCIMLQCVYCTRKRILFFHIVY